MLLKDYVCEKSWVFKSRKNDLPHRVTIKEWNQIGQKNLGIKQVLNYQNHLEKEWDKGRLGLV